VGCLRDVLMHSTRIRRITEKSANASVSRLLVTALVKFSTCAILVEVMTVIDVCVCGLVMMFGQWEDRKRYVG
jgi:hypothetical protein